MWETATHAIAFAEDDDVIGLDRLLYVTCVSKVQRGKSQEYSHLPVSWLMVALQLGPRYPVLCGSDVEESVGLPTAK